MQFEKGFEPGQGNTFTEIVLGPNSMYLPNVTSLTINNGVVETKKGLLPMKRTVPVIPLSNNVGVMQPQCVLSPSQLSECEEV